MRWAWPDRCKPSECASAAAVPVTVLLRPGLLQHSTVESAGIPAGSSAQERYRNASYWRRRAILIGFVIVLGCGLTVLRLVQALGSGGTHRRISRNLLIAFLIPAAGSSIFAAGALHWFELNRERLYYTVLYPYRHSPNYDSRPKGATVTSVVLHATAQKYVWRTVDAFQYPSTRVSAHFVVGKDGEVYQMVPLERRAWHAGASQLDGASDVNDFSIGIEMANMNNGRDPYSDLQYESVAHIIFQLRERYTIPDARIVSHAQVAIPAGHKSDPLGFDFERLRALLQADAARRRWIKAPVIGNKQQRGQ
jgi:N-acetylmuramoyl-L-alanine amidase